jgi:hypothetical protein
MQQEFRFNRTGWADSWTLDAEQVASFGDKEPWRALLGKDGLGCRWSWAMDNARYVVFCAQLSRRLAGVIAAGVSKEVLAERLGCSKGTVTRLADDRQTFKPHWIPGLVYTLGLELGEPNVAHGEEMERNSWELRIAVAKNMIGMVNGDVLARAFQSIGVLSDREKAK